MAVICNLSSLLHSSISISAIITTAVLILATISPMCNSVPVDPFITHYDEIKLTPPQKSDTLDLCPENVNNDKITNFRWFRYHNETQRCWHIDQRGPCGINMIFYRVGDTPYGACECNLYYRCARPLIYWAPEKRCYYTNDQGPCKENEWLIVTSDDDLKPICEPNPCVSNQTAQPSRKERYWFENGGECYMTLTRGYCSHPEEVLYTKWDENKPSCHIGRECNMRTVRGTGTNLQGSLTAASSTRTQKSSPPCLPGQKMDAEGRCRKVMRISWWSVLAR